MTDDLRRALERRASQGDTHAQDTLVLLEARHDPTAQLRRLTGVLEALGEKLAQAKAFAPCCLGAKGTMEWECSLQMPVDFMDQDRPLPQSPLDPRYVTRESLNLRLGLRSIPTLRRDASFVVCRSCLKRVTGWVYPSATRRDPPRAIPGLGHLVLVTYGERP